MGMGIANSSSGISVYRVGSYDKYGSQGGVATPPSGDQESTIDNVQLSDDGRMMVTLLMRELILPTVENVRSLSAKLSQDMRTLLGGLGVDANPPLEFSVGPSGEVQVKGEPADKEKILQAVNGNEKVKEEIRTTTAIASHAAAMAESLKFQQEYRASTSPEGIVAKYSYLFSPGQRSHQISLVYDGSAIDVLSDGKVWLSSGGC